MGTEYNSYRITCPRCRKVGRMVTHEADHGWPSGRPRIDDLSDGFVSFGREIRPIRCLDCSLEIEREHLGHARNPEDLP